MVFADCCGNPRGLTYVGARERREVGGEEEQGTWYVIMARETLGHHDIVIC